MDCGWDGTRLDSVVVVGVPMEADNRRTRWDSRNEYFLEEVGVRLNADGYTVSRYHVIRTLAVMKGAEAGPDYGCDT